MKPTSLLRVLTLAAVVFAAGCGGGDKDKADPTPTPEPTPVGISEVDVNALPLDTPRAQVEQQFGEPLDEAQTRARVQPRILDEEPKRTVCTYYAVLDGTPRDFIQFCYRKGKLGSKLSLIEDPDAAPGGTGVVPGVPQPMSPEQLREQAEQEKQ